MSAPRILVVRVGAMGDVLHGMPAVAALRAALPQAHVGWAIEPRWAPLLRASNDSAAKSTAMPLVDQVHLVPAKQWSRRPLSLVTVRSIAALRAELRSRHYGIAIDLQGSIRSSVIARLSGAAEFIGSATPRERAAWLLYTRRVPLHTVHVVQQAAEIVSAALGRSIVPVSAPLPINAATETWAEQCLATADGDRIAFLAPTAGWGAKQWPSVKFAALAVALKQDGLRVLVNQAGPNDAVAREVVAASQGAAEAVDCTVSQMIALLRRVHLVVAGDTGPLHLAAALGVPTVALFGPTDPARNGPWGNRSVVLRRAESITDHSRHAATESGLASIAVEEVVAAASTLLA